MITKEQADEIVKSNDNFYRKDLVVNGVNVYIYNYLLNITQEFNKLNQELRGLTIVENKVYPSISKFFNINEIPENSETILLDMPIRKIYDKLDGSMIQFINVNGEFIAKSKQSFDSEQAIISQNIFEKDVDLQFFINDCMDNNRYPIFELVGPKNRHVVEYTNDELKLIAVRDLEGHYLDLDLFDCPCNKAEDITNKFTLKELIESQKTQKNAEGYVVQFKNDHLVKIKNLWYLDRHRIREDTERSLEIVKMILNETLDDIIGVKDAFSKDKKNDLLNKQNQLADFVTSNTKKIFDETRNVKSRKDFAIKYKSNEFFGVLMKSINVQEIQEVKDIFIKFLLKKYNKENKCKELFERLNKNN